MTADNRQPDWHAIGPDDVLAQLQTSHHGLNADEAGHRLAEHGRNALRTAERDLPWQIFLHQFTSPLIYVLLVAMVVTLIVGEFADSIVIALVLVINATIGFIQEYRAENAMAALMGLVSPRATVRRDGQRVEIDSVELVPGDLVLLESGDLVPADLRIIDETQLKIDDSVLTGESVAVGKTAAPIQGGTDVPVADRRNLAFMGTSVTSGRAVAAVIATGGNTQIGLIAGEMRSATRAETPLQRRMHRFGNWISVIIIVVSLLAFAVGLLQGVPVPEMFLTAVAAIPEGLPIVMTVALAVCVRRMAKRNAIIRRLPAVETLGSCTVIVSDKTGTLTENRMTVQAIFAGNDTFDVSGTGLDVSGQISRAGAGTPHDRDNSGEDLSNRSCESTSIDASPGSEAPLYYTLLAGMLANESDLKRHPDDNGQMVAHGDPTEVALLVAAAKAKLAREDLLDSYPQIGHIPFESDRRFSATIHTDRSLGDRTVCFVKGAPERVLDMCKGMLGMNGPQPLNREQILAEAHRMAGAGLRLLAMAMGDTEKAIESTRRTEPQGLTFLGLVGMMDPPRPEVIDAIANCHRAGVRVVMCTGDHVSTAAAIAEKIRMVPGLPSGERPEALSGSDLLDMEDAELSDALTRVSVYARVSPTQKLRIVNLLREQGEVVAVTGDGVNDAPALKSAHIGCAMGISGTDVAKEASEMVLADDNFATIYAAVEEGRTAFSNIRKATDFLLSTSIGVVLAIFATFFLVAIGIVIPTDRIEGIPLLMLPAQILWLNVVTAGTQDVALAFEPGERQQYTRPPRDPNEGLLSGPLLERTIIIGMLLAVVAVCMFGWELHRGSELAYAQGATLTAVVIFKMLHVGACRSETLSIFEKNVFSNRMLFICASASLLVHLGAMHFGPTQALLNLQPLDIESWLAVLVVAPTVLIVAEVHKFLRGRGERNCG